MQFSKLATILSVAMIVGCATKPVSDSAAKAAPAERLFAHQTPIEGGGILVVTRDAGFQGSACAVSVLINGAEAARLEAGERAAFQLPAGEAILGVQPFGRGLCGAGSDRMRRETGLMMKSGDTRKYRTGIGSSGEPLIAPTAY
ncbi:hypothetical protein [Xanthomonas maliensis]|uniref:hypothetical protein n=1 Tax=Xanthomonas maliensis TaxID=1321368 RepID=UPI00126438E3|nr:hypothetical protein [Xanthomonas maliensis]